MNGSSALNLINSRISKLFKFACVASTIAALIAGSFVLPASAAALDTSDWLDLYIETHLYTDLGGANYGSNPVIHELFMRKEDPSESYSNSMFTIGSSDDPMFDPVFIIASSKIPIYQDTTYKLTYDLRGVCTYSDHQYTELSFGNSFPSEFSDVLFSPTSDFISKSNCNSNSIPYDNLISHSINRNTTNGRLLGFEVVFSTADGFIDNLPSADLVMNNVLSVYDESGILEFNISLIKCTAIFDPSADYYIELSKQHQNELVDATVDTVTNAKSYLDQITVFDNISSTKDQLASSISSAASWFSPLARSGDSLVSAAGTVNTIYESVMNNTHSYCGMLVTVIPVLCFFKWLMSMVLRF